MLIDTATNLLRLLPAETAHRATIRLTRGFGPLFGSSGQDDPRLAVSIFGLNFPNPIGLAAGFDKDAEVPDQMLQFGFGYVECGTVTPRPQLGNPPPRLFRLVEDGAVINRMGFNSAGMKVAGGNLVGRTRRGIVGINVGANKESTDRVADYTIAFAALAPLADYVTVNVSSPNTPGLRGLQNRDELERLLTELVSARRALPRVVPLLLKIAPDLEAEAIDDIARVVLDSGIEGVVVSNTTVARPESLRSAHRQESGGLSGKPLFAPSTHLLSVMRAKLGPRVVLIGVGGISSGADAYAKIRAGASLVQLYTALAFEGPGLIPRVKRELLQALEHDGIARVTDAIGLDVRQ